MEITRNHQAEGEFGSSAFVPPQGDVCFINNLPPESLSRIFELGCDESDYVGDDLSSVFVLDNNEAIDPWDFLRSLDGDTVDGERAHDNGSGVTGEHEDEPGGGVEMGADEMDTRIDDEEVEEDLGALDAVGEADEGDLTSDATGSFDSVPAFQILVTHVCRRWREVAFSTPSLWRTICVSPTAGVSCEPGLMLLERSKDLPIDVCINCQLSNNKYEAAAPSDHELRSLFSIFVPHIHRWRKMIIGASEHTSMHEFLKVASDPSISAAPQLTTFELYYNSGLDSDTTGYRSMPKDLILFGGSAPSLTTLALWGVSIDWTQQWVASASKLRALALAFHSEDDRPSWTQFASILRGAPTLEKLTLHDSGPSGDPFEWFIEFTPGSPADLNAPVRLPRLKEFIVAHHSQAGAIQLFRKLHLPALRNLVLDLYDDDYSDFVNELAAPVTFSSSVREQPRSLLSRLERLALAGLFCDPDCVATLYGELQNLTTLKVTGSPSMFLDILTMPRTSDGAWSGRVWLPRLATLYVCRTTGPTIRDVVQRRNDVGVPLSALYVEMSCAVDREDVQWLAENVETLKFLGRVSG